MCNSIGGRIFCICLPFIYFSVAKGGREKSSEDLRRQRRRLPRAQRHELNTEKSIERKKSESRIRNGKHSSLSRVYSYINRSLFFSYSNNMIYNAMFYQGLSLPL